MQHHRHGGCGQGEGRQGVERGGSGAAVKGHAEAQGWPLAVQGGAEISVEVEHPGQFLGLGAADAMGDQKGPDLGFACLP